MKNLLIRTTVRLLKKKATQPPPHKFLILSTTGLGDTLWGTPAIRALRAAHPSAYIGVLTSPIGQEILKYNPHISELFVVSDPVFSQLPRLYQQLKTKHITDILLFHTSQRSLLPLAATLGASTLIGTEGLHKGLDALLTHPISNQYVHEIERRLHLVAHYQAHPQSPFMEIALSEDDIRLGTEIVAPFDQQYRIALHPGAKDLFKQWPPSLFIELGNHLSQELSCQIVVTGTPAEASLVNAIATHIPGAIPLTHLRLRPFAAFLQQMDLLISNDTGPMHVGFAMQTPTIALFTPTDPHLCGPYQFEKSTVIMKSRTCTPCIKKKCAEPFCLLQITPQEVYHAAKKLLLKD